MSTDWQIAASMLLALPVAAAVSWGALKVGFPVTASDNRLGYVDGLRGFLALSVMFHHFALWVGLLTLGRPWGPASLSLFNNLGKGGVCLFFMITGAVFYPRVLQGIDRVNWSGLLVSRLFRIIPLSIAATAIAAIASWVAMHGAGREAPATLIRDTALWLSGYKEPSLFHYPNSYRLNAGVLWSLWYEWGFYFLILPITAGASAAIRGRLPSYLVPVSLLLISLTLRIIMPASEKPVFLSLFALGMIVSELRKVALLVAVSRRPSTSAMIVTALTAALFLVTQPYSLVLQAGYTALLLSVACGNPFFGAVSQRASRVLGDASFSIYMLHGFVLAGLMPLLTKGMPRASLFWLPIVVGVTIPLAFLSYVLIERPMIEAGKRVAHWRPARDRSLEIEAAP